MEAVALMERELSADEGWRRVYEYGMQRAEDLGWYKARLYDVTVSEPTWNRMRDGKPALHRAPNRKKVCEKLGWTPDSIDRILRGLEPLLASEFSRPDGVDVTTEDLAKQVAEMERELRELRRRLGGSPQPDQPED